LLQKLIHERRLAVVHVSDDGNIANVLHGAPARAAGRDMLLGSVSTSVVTRDDS
jgi:hypothetical protein